MNLINILTITHPENGKTVFFRFANSSWQAFGNWHVILKYLTPELITLHYFMTYTHNGSKDWQLINIFNNKVCHQIYTCLGVKNRISILTNYQNVLRSDYGQNLSSISTNMYFHFRFIICRNVLSKFYHCKCSI